MITSLFNSRKFKNAYLRTYIIIIIKFTNTWINEQQKNEKRKH